jgi:phosphoglycerate dehydrogenase-like enzyme
MNILVLTEVTEAHKRLLESAAPGADFTYTTAKAATDGEIARAEVIFGNVRWKQLAKAKNLRFLQLFTAGTDGYTDILPQGAALCNTTGAFGLALSEHMLAMLLMLQKRLHQYRDNQSRHEWRDMGSVTSIEGSTVLVLGLGDIGGAFARKMKALGAYVIGVRRKDTQKPDHVDELALTSELDALLPRADIIAMALPNTPETVHILDERRFAMMKRGAIIINVGRGSAIDQNALADAAEAGRVLAGLDVTDPEPLPPEDRLWGIENILITPHISGYFHLRATHDRIVAVAAENIARYVEGRPLINRIDLETGYRADKYDGGEGIFK